MGFQLFNLDGLTVMTKILDDFRFFASAHEKQTYRCPCWDVLA